jgi:hypothetical protein
MPLLASKLYAPEFTLSRPEYSEGVEFYAKFENANLHRAIRVTQTEYELLLSPDFNTHGHLHWFYFKTRSKLPPRTEVCFKILNLTKPRSLYSEGFRPFAFSVKHHRTHGIGWRPSGTHVRYYANHIVQTPAVLAPGLPQGPAPSQLPQRPQSHFTLEWKYVYEYGDDEVFFAQSQPYTYSDLLHDLQDIKRRHASDNIVRTNILCKTEADNSCPMVTITENVGTFLRYESEALLKGKLATTKKLLVGKAEKLRIRTMAKQLAKKSKLRRGKS